MSNPPIQVSNPTSACSLALYPILGFGTAPVTGPDGQIIAVVAGQINMGEIWKITDRVRIDKTGFVFLVNKEGNFIAYPHKDKILSKLNPPMLLEKFLSYSPGFVEYQAEELEKRVCGFVTLKGYLDYKGKDWRIGVTQSAKEAYGIIRTTQATIFSTAFGFFIIIILVSLSLTRDIIKPVESLVAGTAKIAAGDLTTQIKISSEDELGKLAIAFNQMTKDLKKSVEKIEEYSRTLEQQVEERTRKLKEAQANLIQTAKMASIGTLAGGVAHEINNPLGAILTNAQMLCLETKDDSQRESLRLIEEAARRCRDIVQTLLKYSRKPGFDEFVSVNLNEVIIDTCHLIESQLEKEQIRIVIEHGEIPNIKGNANELSQVLTNMLINSKNAIKKIKDSGIITIKTYRENDFAIMQVIDNGCGIPKENINKIFDPFFTTMEVGKGTGLGLYISQKILEKHNGSVEVSSKPLEGSTFTIKIPMERG